MATIPQGWEEVSEVPAGWEVVDEAPAPAAAPRPGPVKSEPFKETSTGRDLVAGVGGGLYGAGLGAAQLLVEGAQTLLPKPLEGPLERWKQGLREEEADRREVMGLLKEKHGERGVTNPISWAEFAGETAPYAAAGGLSVGRAVTSKLPVSYLRTAGEGALIGGAMGAAAPLAEDESRLASTGLGAAAGAVLSPAVRGVAEGVGAGTRFGREKLISWKELRRLRRADPEVGRIMDGPGKIVEEGIRRVAPRKASQAQTPEAVAREIKNDLSAVQTIAKLRDDIELTRGGVPVKGELPRTLDEALEATSQSAGKVAGWIDEISKAAGAQGVRVPVNNVTAELGKVSVSRGYLPNQEALAQRWLAQLEPIAQEGGLSTPAALRLMTNLNNDIRAIFTGKNVSGDSPELLGVIAGKLRESLNKTLEATDGGAQFGALRAELGKLMNLEKRLLLTVEKEANRNAKTHLSAFDIIAAEQLIHGMPTQAAASWATNKVIKLLASPNRAVRRIFRTADYMVGKNRMSAPQVPQVPPPTTYFDPAIGARTPLRPSTSPRVDTGTSAGQPFKPSTAFDPTVGARVPTRPDVRPRVDTGTSAGRPYQGETYFDPVIGARTAKQQAYSRKPQGKLPRLSKPEALDAFAKVKDELSKLDPDNPQHLDRIAQLSIMEDQYRQILAGKAQPSDFAPKGR